MVSAVNYVLRCPRCGSDYRPDGNWEFALDPAYQNQLAAKIVALNRPAVNGMKLAYSMMR